MALIPAQRIFHYVAAHPTSVSKVLQEHFKLSQEKSAELIELGSIYLNKKRVFSDVSLPKSAYLRLHLHPKRFPVQRIAWNSVLLKEGPDYVVVRKPAGIPTHATVDNAIENTLAQVRKALNLELFVTQRLDTPVSGALLFAKTKKFQAQFNQWLSERKIQKTYAAWVEKECPTGKMLHYMEPSERSPRVLSHEPKAGWLPCELTVLSCLPKVVEQKNLYELKIDLHTGRTHQIRAQLAYLECPIVGDRLYGSKLKVSRKEEIALSAIKISWPSSETVEIPFPYWDPSLIHFSQ